jgi:phosphoribosyl 1,2-cyclic phosphodiesterase
VQAAGYNVLIDCGLTATTLKKYLAEYQLQPHDISAVFLTHEHSDHIRGAGTVARTWDIPVIANTKTLTAARYRWQKIDRLEQNRARQLGETAPDDHSRYNTEVLEVGGVKSYGPLEISSFPVSHDASDSVCYTFKAMNQQGVILTDLGCATPEIYEPLNASQLLILEANHDVQKLQRSNYPAALKARIRSNVGHLSNEQSAQILEQVLDQSGYRRTVWLAHLSEENNSPKDAVETLNRWLDKAGMPRLKLQVAGRDKPSLRWDSETTFFQAQMLF